jgi:hypothetical protein
LKSNEKWRYATELPYVNGLNYHCKVQVSISPTFYEQLFRTKFVLQAFLYLMLYLFWSKKIGEKVTLKMLVKLAIDQ